MKNNERNYANYFGEFSKKFEKNWSENLSVYINNADL